jgi:hypothetical protein
MASLRTRIFNSLFGDRKFNLVAISVFIALLATFIPFGTLTSNDTLIITNKTGESWYNVTLKSIDYAQKTIDTDISIGAQKGQKELITYFKFVNYYSTSTSSGWGLQKERLTLTESSEQPSDMVPGYSVYQASRKVRFATELDKFPFDKIDIGLGIETRPELSPGDQVYRQPPLGFVVRSLIPDYTLIKSDREVSTLRLKRTPFLVTLAIFVFLVAFFTARGIILQEEKQKRDVSLLAYFVGLWAIRNVIMGVVVGPKPFPTYVDLGIIFLFLLTVIGIEVANIDRVRRSRLEQQAEDVPRIKLEE